MSDRPRLNPLKAGDRGGKQKRSPFTLINKKMPPEKTFAEEYYYKKQMEGKTVMVIRLTDGEEVRGNIEWYDKDCIKLNRLDRPSIVLRKSVIKYMYKELEDKGAGPA